MPRITFLPNRLTFDVPDGTTILTAAVRNGVHLQHDCTEAVCGTDRVKILTGGGNLSEKLDNEELTLGMMNAGPDERLACAAKIQGDVAVEIPA
ncbi:MAG TPA: 2Fe-2S iron-sulfur cluster-binding protein [Candidatus Binatia bacterium]